MPFRVDGAPQNFNNAPAKSLRLQILQQGRFRAGTLEEKQTRMTCDFGMIVKHKCRCKAIVPWLVFLKAQDLGAASVGCFGGES